MTLLAPLMSPHSPHCVIRRTQFTAFCVSVLSSVPCTAHFTLPPTLPLVFLSPECVRAVVLIVLFVPALSGGLGIPASLLRLLQPRACHLPQPVQLVRRVCSHCCSSKLSPCLPHQNPLCMCHVLAPHLHTVPCCTDFHCLLHQLPYHWRGFTKGSKHQPFHWWGPRWETAFARSRSRR